jgi:hypothetical protein
MRRAASATCGAANGRRAGFNSCAGRASIRAQTDHVAWGAIDRARSQKQRRPLKKGLEPISESPYIRVPGAIVRGGSLRANARTSSQLSLSGGLLPRRRVGLWTGRVRQEGMRGRRPVGRGLRHPGKGGGVGVRARSGCGRSLAGAPGRGGGGVRARSPLSGSLGTLAVAKGRPCAVMPWGQSPFPQGAGGQAESLILAQNERWRRA